MYPLQVASNSVKQKQGIGQENIKNYGWCHEDITGQKSQRYEQNVVKNSK